MRWTIVETPRFLENLTKIGPPGYNWADSKLGLRWYLERDPRKVGFATQDLDVRILPFDTPNGIPDINVFFEIDDDNHRVRLLSVRGVEPDPF